MLVITPIHKDHSNAIQLLMQRCSDYLEFQDEKPVSAMSALELLEALPPGASDEQKSVLGIMYENALIGLFDLIFDFPRKSVVTLGLMVIEPSLRGKGNGQEAYRQLEHSLLGRKASVIRLGVLFGNEAGLRFWQRQGFAKTGEVKPYLSHQFFVLEKNLGQAQTDSIL